MPFSILHTDKSEVVPTHVIVDFVYNSILATVVCAALLSSFKKLFHVIVNTLANHPIPPAAAYIPSKLPHPNPPGAAIPFGIPLLQASEEQIAAFMAFRGEKLSASVKETPDATHKEEQRLETLRQKRLEEVARVAAEYRGLLYEERTMKWIDDHFRLKLRNLKYPFVDRHWNGWSSFWLETGPHLRSMCVASFTLIFEHIVNGFIFPMCYLVTHDIFYVKLALYGEVGFMIYASGLILMSYRLGRDVTIEQMHRSVWHLLLLHHLCALILCSGCLILADRVPMDLVSYFLLALLGLTSSLHYVGVVLDFSPLSYATSPKIRFWNHVFCLFSQLWFRGIYWWRLSYLAVMHTFDMHGLGLAIFVTLIMLLFTAFNVDFVKFHFKATKGCWERMNLKNL